jgi:hypothetical protein
MPDSYRAVVLPAFNADLIVEERAFPTALMGPDAQMLKVVAAGVCHSDVHVVEGRWPALPTPLVMGARDHGRDARGPCRRLPAVGLRHLPLLRRDRGATL